MSTDQAAAHALDGNVEAEQAHALVDIEGQLGDLSEAA